MVIIDINNIWKEEEYKVLFEFSTNSIKSIKYLISFKYGSWSNNETQKKLNF